MILALEIQPCFLAALIIFIPSSCAHNVHFMLSFSPFLSLTLPVFHVSISRTSHPNGVRRTPDARQHLRVLLCHKRRLYRAGPGGTMLLARSCGTSLSLIPTHTHNTHMERVILDDMPCRISTRSLLGLLRIHRCASIYLSRATVGGASSLNRFTQA